MTVLARVLVLVLVCSLMTACGDADGDNDAAQPGDMVDEAPDEGSDDEDDTDDEQDEDDEEDEDDADDEDDEEDGMEGGDSPPPLALEPSQAPIELPQGAEFYEDVFYGDSELNTFDIMVPDTDEPTPLVVYIHGGGFTGGDKQSVYPRYEEEIVRWLDEGIAVATINYRLLVENDDTGVIKPLGDSRYCLQFMRYHAESLNIDPTRVALFGGSAGAGTSLWLGANDDMADADAEDPVERMSTRVSAVAIFATQGTYDIVRWETDVFDEFGITLELLLMVAPEMASTLQSFYGLGELSPEETLEALERPDVAQYRASVDMLSLLDPTDPPVRIESNGTDARPSDIGGLYHHPNHGREVRQAALDADVEVFANLPRIDIVDDELPSLGDFMSDRLR